MEQHVFALKVTQILPTSAAHVQLVQFQFQTKILVNVKVLQFSIKTLSDVFNFTNVHKTQLESFRVEFTDVNATKIFILTLISVYIVQHLVYGIQPHYHVIVQILLKTGMEELAFHVDQVRSSILLPDFVNVFLQELLLMENADAQITFYGMKQLKIVNVQANLKCSTKPQIRAIVLLLTSNLSVDNVDSSAHKMNGGQLVNVNVKLLS